MTCTCTLSPRIKKQMRSRRPVIKCKLSRSAAVGRGQEVNCGSTRVTIAPIFITVKKVVTSLMKCKSSKLRFTTFYSTMSVCHSIADHVHNPGKKCLDAPAGRVTQFREVAPAGITFKIVACVSPLLPKHWLDPWQCPPHPRSGNALLSSM